VDDDQQDASPWPRMPEAARRFSGNPQAEAMVTALEYGQPYQWGKVGPPATIEHAGAVVPVSQTMLDDMSYDVWGSIREMMRRDAIRRRAMRRLKLADPAGYARLQALLRLGEAARRDREDREREARRCPTCGCDPDGNGQDW
jgi:hypothetical protein